MNNFTVKKWNTQSNGVQTTTSIWIHLKPKISLLTSDANKPPKPCFLSAPNQEPPRTHSAYTVIIQSIITSSITVWYGNTDSHSRTKLQCTVSKACKIISFPLPTVESIYCKRVTKWADEIISDPSHPANHLLQSLPFSRHFRSLATKTHFKSSFFLTAIITLNFRC